MPVRRVRGAKQRCEGGTFGSGVKIAESAGSSGGLQVVKALGDIVEVLSDIRDSLDDWRYEGGWSFGRFGVVRGGVR